MLNNSAHDLSNNSKASRLFVPRKLFTGKKKRFSTRQEIWFVVFGFVYAIGSIFCWTTLRMRFGVGGPILWGIFTFFAQKFFRKFILHEKAEIDRYMDFLEGQVTDLLPFWNIVDIGASNDVKNAGRITYVSGVEAYVIAIEREYSFGRRAGFKAIHYSGVTDVITHILQEGYNYVYYSYDIGTPNTEPLGDTVTVLRNFPESPIYLIVSKIINYVRDFVGNVPVEVEYYLIYTNGSTEQARKLRHDCEVAVDGFRGTLYGKARMLNKEELIDFFLKYHGLEHLDEKTLYRKFGKESDINVIYDINRNEAGDILRIDDDFKLYDGTEEYDNLIRDLYKAREQSNDK